MIDLLRKAFEVEIFDRDALKGSQLIQAIKQYAPSTVVYYQLPPSPVNHLIPLWSCQSIWIPMWDGFKPLSPFKRAIFRFQGVKVISFCKALHQKVLSASLPSLPVRYFPPIEPAKRAKLEPPYTLFFWERASGLKLAEVESLFPKGWIDKIIYKGPSTGSTLPVERLPDWGSVEAYFDAVKRADFYIAPRYEEGIGMSFLEGMGLGVIPVGYDAPTMNEYIQHGINGYLFKDDMKIDPIRSDSELSEGLHSSCRKFAAEWQSDQNRILDWMEPSR